MTGVISVILHWKLEIPEMFYRRVVGWAWRPTNDVIDVEKFLGCSSGVGRDIVLVEQCPSFAAVFWERGRQQDNNSDVWVWKWFCCFFQDHITVTLGVQMSTDEDKEDDVRRVWATVSKLNSFSFSQGNKTYAQSNNVYFLLISRLWRNSYFLRPRSYKM